MSLHRSRLVDQRPTPNRRRILISHDTATNTRRVYAGELDSRERSPLADTGKVRRTRPGAGPAVVVLLAVLAGLAMGAAWGMRSWIVRVGR